MTSANVVFYDLKEDGVLIDSISGNILCKFPLTEFMRKSTPTCTVTMRGLDEYEAPWEGEPTPIREFMESRRSVFEDYLKQQ